jgi:hypothetical protein
MSVLTSAPSIKIAAAISSDSSHCFAASKFRCAAHGEAVQLAVQLSATAGQQGGAAAYNGDPMQ